MKNKLILVGIIFFALNIAMVVNDFSSMRFSTIAEGAATVKLSSPLPGQEAGIEVLADPVAYIKTVYWYLLGASFLLAMLILVVAGVKWIASAGNAAFKQDAMDMIKNAVFGIVLLFIAILILNTIRPLSESNLGIPKVDVGQISSGSSAGSGFTNNPSPPFLFLPASYINNNEYDDKDLKSTALAGFGKGPAGSKDVILFKGAALITKYDAFDNTEDMKEYFRDAAAQLSRMIWQTKDQQQLFDLAQIFQNEAERVKKDEYSSGLGSNWQGMIAAYSDILNELAGATRARVLGLASAAAADDYRSLADTEGGRDLKYGLLFLAADENGEDRLSAWAKDVESSNSEDIKTGIRRTDYFKVILEKASVTTDRESLSMAKNLITTKMMWSADMAAQTGYDSEIQAAYRATHDIYGEFSRTIDGRGLELNSIAIGDKYKSSQDAQGKNDLKYGLLYVAFGDQNDSGDQFFLYATKKNNASGGRLDAEALKEILRSTDHYKLPAEAITNTDNAESLSIARELMAAKMEWSNYMARTEYNQQRKAIYQATYDIYGELDAQLQTRIQQLRGGSLSPQYKSII